MDHYFNYLPKIEGEEKRYRHPTFPLECNQWGIVFPDEGWDLVQNGVGSLLARQTKKNGKKILVGSRHRIVWECYTQLSAKGTTILHQDGNFLNFSIENLISTLQLTPKENRKIYDRKKEFIVRSMKHMLKKDSILFEKGLDPCLYWELVQVPPLIMKEYLIWNGIEQRVVKTKINPEITAKRKENLENILTLKDAGHSNRQIASILSIKSPATVNYWLKKAENNYDI